MSATTEIAKKAFPIAMIALLSGTYYCAAYFPAGEERNTGDPSKTQLRRLQTSDLPVRNLPADNRPKPISVPDQDYQVRTAAGEFAADVPGNLHLSNHDSLDDFELTVAPIELEAPNGGTLSHSPEPVTHHPSLNGLPNSSRGIEQPIRPDLGTSSVSPVPVGSRNGQMISNPYINTATPSPTEPPLAIEFSVNEPFPNQNETAAFAPKVQQNINSLTELSKRSKSNTTMDSARDETQNIQGQPSVRSILENENRNGGGIGHIYDQQREPSGVALPLDEPTVDLPTGGMRPVIVLPLPSAVSNQIQSHLDYGNSLARRSATLLAKREFTKGLQIVAESSDNQLGTHTHLQALQEGFTALREAADFDTTDGMFNFDMLRLAESHDTPIIRMGHFKPNTPSQARKAYMLFAQDRIVQAVNKHSISAELLHALGKTYLVDATYGTHPQRLDFARAAVLFQCSLIVEPQHVRSANELGVILARSGRLADAKVLFQNAIRSEAEFTEGWNNLAKVHQQLGEEQLAQLASFEASRQKQEPNDSIQLVDAKEFNSLSGAWGLPEGEQQGSQLASPRTDLQDNAQALANQQDVTKSESSQPLSSWFQNKEQTTPLPNRQIDFRANENRTGFKTFGGF